MANTLPKMRGRSDHSLDEKGRVIIPVRFREAIGDEFMLVRAPGPCLRIYPMPLFEKLEDQLQSKSILDETNRDKLIMQRLFYDAAVCSLDQQFRLTIPKTLQTWAEFGKIENETVIIMGMRDKLELWSHTSWAAFQEKYNSDETNNASARLQNESNSVLTAAPLPTTEA